MKRYLHIGINWIGQPNTGAIQSLIEAPNAVEDWFKYGGNCWIVYTQYDQSAWATYLQPHMGGSSLIIYEVTNLSKSNGVLPLTLWEWFNRVRY